MSNVPSVRLTDDPNDFISLAAPFLCSEPFTCNVIAVEVEGIVSGRRPVREGSLWALAEEGGRPVGIAMHTPPRSLFLPRLAVHVSEAIADALAGAGRHLPGVIGETGTVECFLKRWETRTGSSARLQVSMRMYVLGTLAKPTGVAGEGRRALPGDES